MQITRVLRSTDALYLVRGMSWTRRFIKPHQPQKRGTSASSAKTLQLQSRASAATRCDENAEREGILRLRAASISPIPSINKGLVGTRMVF